MDAPARESADDPSPLFPAPAERRRWQHYLTEMLDEAETRVASGPVTPAIDLAAFRRALDEFDFQHPAEFGSLLDWTIASLERGLVHLNHPRYFGLFNPAPTFPAQCADRIVASFNPQLASATTSPAAVEIEAHVIRAVARRTGLGPQAAGHFTSGGSEANCTALISALTWINQDFATSGSRAFSGQPVFYISQDSHLAWVKIAHQTGIGRDAARLIPTDGAGRMNVEDLAEAVRSDKAQGRVPVMIVATAGTTNAGMIDPLAACGEIAREFGLWYHVDAAWGGGLIASPRFQHLLAGIENADSVTIDAHKWFATTMGCGMFLTARPEILSAAFNVTASFMPSQAASIDPYLNTAQWSRRFGGLRLFLSLAAGGWAAHAMHVERSIELAAQFAGKIADCGWSVRNRSGLAVVCVTPPEGSPPVQAIVARIVNSGRAWVSVARFEGQDTVRVCVTHGETNIDDIREVVAALVQAREDGGKCGDEQRVTSVVG